MMVDFSPKRSDRPCYFVLPICEASVAELIASDEFGITGGRDPGTAFRQVFDRPLSFREMSNIAGLSEGEIKDYLLNGSPAKKKKYTIRDLSFSYMKANA